MAKASYLVKGLDNGLGKKKAETWFERRQVLYKSLSPSSEFHNVLPTLMNTVNRTGTGIAVP